MRIAYSTLPIILALLLFRGARMAPDVSDELALGAARRQLVRLTRGGGTQAQLLEARDALSRFARYAEGFTNDQVIADLVAEYRTILLTHPTSARDTHHLRATAEARAIGLTDIELGLALPPMPSATREIDLLNIILDGQDSTKLATAVVELRSYPRSTPATSLLLESLPHLHGANVGAAFEVFGCAQNPRALGAFAAWFQDSRLNTQVRRESLTAMRVVEACVSYLGVGGRLTAEEAADIRRVLLDPKSPRDARHTALAVLKDTGAARIGDTNYLRILKDEGDLWFRREVAGAVLRLADRDRNPDLHRAVAEFYATIGEPLPSPR